MNNPSQSVQKRREREAQASLERYEEERRQKGTKTLIGAVFGAIAVIIFGFLLWRGTFHNAIGFFGVGELNRNIQRNYVNCRLPSNRSHPTCNRNTERPVDREWREIGEGLSPFSLNEE